MKFENGNALSARSCLVRGQKLLSIYFNQFFSFLFPLSVSSSLFSLKILKFMRENKRFLLLCLIVIIVVCLAASQDSDIVAFLSVFKTSFDFR